MNKGQRTEELKLTKKQKSYIEKFEWFLEGRLLHNIDSAQGKKEELIEDGGNGVTGNVDLFSANELDSIWKRWKELKYDLNFKTSMCPWRFESDSDSHTQQMKGGNK